MLRVKKQIVLITIGTVMVATMSYALVKNSNWTVKQVKNNVIYFTNGQRLKTRHFDVKMLGQLELKKNSPLYIFAGAECQNCDAQEMVFLVSPAEKSKIVTPEYAPYDFPGREFSTVDSTLLYESRMYYGNVLPDVKNGIIWYQTMLDDDNQYRKSVYLIKIENEKLTEDLIFEDVPVIETTLALLKAHKCTEVKGVDYVNDGTEE
jgi:hypothetical protein